MKATRKAHCRHCGWEKMCGSLGESVQALASHQCGKDGPEHLSLLDRQVAKPGEVYRVLHGSEGKASAAELAGYIRADKQRARAASAHRRAADRAREAALIGKAARKARRAAERNARKVAA